MQKRFNVNLVRYSVSFAPMSDFSEDDTLVYFGKYDSFADQWKDKSTMINGYLQYDLTYDLTLMGDGEVRNNDGGELLLLGSEYKNFAILVWLDTDKSNQEYLDSHFGVVCGGKLKAQGH